MITVTRLNGEEIVLNAGLIELVEKTPDTLITLATGRKIMVRETSAEVAERATAYYRRIGYAAVAPPRPGDPGGPEARTQELRASNPR